MPVVSTFLGIVITMYFGDHPPKHFHVRYNEFEASIAIDTLLIVEGNLPPRILSLVKEWAELHKEELLVNWQKASKHEPLERIKGLV